MPDPAPQTNKEVVLPMNVNLAEAVEFNLPPLVIKVSVPQAFFVPSMKPE
jgi:hypothetical protein